MAPKGVAGNRNASRKRGKNAADGGVPATWPNLPHDILFIILMKLGVIDFIAFSGVCKSWRSFAHANRESFMASREPLSLYISPHATRTIYLIDPCRRKAKTLLPSFEYRSLVGVRCGYLIMFGRKTHDFLLVNPITRHEIRFPVLDVKYKPAKFRPVLVFSRSLAAFVLVVFFEDSKTIMFAPSVHVTASWELLVTPSTIVDLHAFKGKIYVLESDGDVSEVRLHRAPALTRLGLDIGPKVPFKYVELVSSTEKLFVLDFDNPGSCLVRELDFENAKWVPRGGKFMNEHAIFLSEFKCNAIVDRAKWVNPGKRYVDAATCFVCFSRKFGVSSLYPRVVDAAADHVQGKVMNVWYFPHDCLGVNVLEE